MAALRGKAYWAKVHEAVPNRFDPEKIEYSINIGHLTEEDKVFLTRHNLGDKIKTDPKGTMGDYIQMKARNTKRVYNQETGEPDEHENSIVVVDENKEPISSNVLIGNESEVVVSFKPIHYKRYDVWAAELLGVQVLNLNQYTAAVDPMADFDEAANFSA